MNTNQKQSNPVTVTVSHRTIKRGYKKARGRWLRALEATRKFTASDMPLGVIQHLMDSKRALLSACNLMAANGLACHVEAREVQPDGVFKKVLQATKARIDEVAQREAAERGQVVTMGLCVEAHGPRKYGFTAGGASEVSFARICEENANAIGVIVEIEGTVGAGVLLLSHHFLHLFRLPELGGQSPAVLSEPLSPAWGRCYPLLRQDLFTSLRLTEGGPILPNGWRYKRIPDDLQAVRQEIAAALLACRSVKVKIESLS